MWRAKTLKTAPNTACQHSFRKPACIIQWCKWVLSFPAERERYAACRLYLLACFLIQYNISLILWTFNPYYQDFCLKVGKLYSEITYCILHSICLSFEGLTDYFSHIPTAIFTDPGQLDFIHWNRFCCVFRDRIHSAAIICFETKIWHVLWIYTTVIRSFGKVVQTEAQWCDSKAWPVHDTYNPKWKFIRILYFWLISIAFEPEL